MNSEEDLSFWCRLCQLLPPFSSASDVSPRGPRRDGVRGQRSLSELLVRPGALRCAELIGQLAQAH